MLLLLLLFILFPLLVAEFAAPGVATSLILILVDPDIGCDVTADKVTVTLVPELPSIVEYIIGLNLIVGTGGGKEIILKRRGEEKEGEREGGERKGKRVKGGREEKEQGKEGRKRERVAYHQYPLLLQKHWVP